ncbi:carboxypeptidase-like regulatory domain-containing protein [Cesiribacter andamanensis]|uniref:carboxypeptidase-like regulatory domain-containing protein n=1 Tax=Cesiribacter andamanensis TaxID=649507 RepID=UPI0005906C5A|nr:carboxypeptidase-like regulatory domain-containing protein [Cesiribacter andamanensis]
MKVTRTPYVLLLPLLVALVLFSQPVQAQRKAPVVQFSGIVMAADDSAAVLPGVHIYVPKAGRGTVSNPLGYFSMPVLVGDSVVISYTGYQKQHYKIPNNIGDAITVIIELSPDTAYLPEITIFPYPTEQLFKQAILAMELPKEEEDIMKRNMDATLLALMMENMEMDGSENYKRFSQQQIMDSHNRYFIRTNPFFNPLNWAKFIQSIKRGEYSRDKK